MADPELWLRQLYADEAVRLIVADRLIEAPGMVGRRLQLTLRRNGRIAVLLIDGDRRDGPLRILLGRHARENLPGHEHGVDRVRVLSAVGRHGDRAFRAVRGL